MIYLIIREYKLIKEGYKLSNISWNQFMDNLRLLDNNDNPIISYTNFNADILNNLDIEKEQIWEALINYLKNESDETELSHDYYRISDLPNSNPQSFLKYITKNIDLPASFSEDILSSLKMNLNESPNPSNIDEKKDLLLLKKLTNLLVQYSIKNHTMQYIDIIQRLDTLCFSAYYETILHEEFNFHTSSYRNLNDESSALFEQYEQSILSSDRIADIYKQQGFYFVNFSTLIGLRNSDIIFSFTEEEIDYLQEAMYLLYKQMYYYLKNDAEDKFNILYNKNLTDYNTWVYNLLNLTGKTIEDLEQSSEFWNQSLNSLIKYIIANFDPEYVNDSTEIIVDENTKFKIENIKKANAANSFDEHGEWVHSWINGKGETYEEIRGKDKQISALMNKDNLDETNREFMNLLMPRNERNVEIEDLNRNFWVIGQSLAGISAFLFSAGSPFTKTFQGIIKEIVDIWENILYLWIAFAISLQNKKYYTDIHEEVVYINQNEYQNEFKYDNFNNNLLLNYIENNNLTAISDYIKPRINYFKAKYPTCHLCIIPVIRLHNYDHNYYSTEYYPGVFLYNRNDDNNDWQFTPFNIMDGGNNSIYASIFTTLPNFNNDAIKITNGAEIGITNNNLNDIYYYGTNTTQDSDAPYIGNPPYLNYHGIKKSNITFYKLTRLEYSTKENFENSKICKYDNENNELIFNSFKIIIHDVASEIQGQLEYSPTQVEWYRENNLIVRQTINTRYYTPPYPFYNQTTININQTTLQQWPLCGYNAEDFSELDSILFLAPIKITHNNCGFYMGELLSYRSSFQEEIVEN